MDSLPKTLHVLRAACHQPSKQNWSRICNALWEPMEPEALQVVLDYAGSLLQAWPAALCRVTPKQWRRIRSRGGCPWWPLVRRAELRAAPGDAALLARLCEQGGLESLRMDQAPLHPEELAQLAASRLPQELRRLNLQHAGLRDEHLEALLSAPWLALEHLDLSWNQLQLAVPSLAWDAMPALEELALDQNKLSLGALERFALQGPPSLRRLSLYNIGSIGVPWSQENAAKTAALQEMERSPRLASLREISLPLSDILSSEAGLWARFQPKQPPSFAPGMSVLNHAVISTLLGDEKLSEVAELTLRMEHFALEDVEQTLELFCRHPLPSLRSLHLCGSLRPEVLQRLLAAPWLTQLEELALYSPLSQGYPDPRPLGDEGAGAVASCAALASLRRLELVQQEMSAQGALALARSPHLARLRWLVLWGNSLGEAGCLELLQAPLVRQLEGLWINVLGYGPEVTRCLLDHPAFSLEPVQDIQYQRLGWRQAHDLKRLMAGVVEEKLAPASMQAWEALCVGWRRWRPEALDLRHVALPAEVVEPLAQAQLDCVRKVSLSYHTQQEVLVALIKLPWVARLWSLDLNEMVLGGEAVEALVSWEGCQIQQLVLEGCRGLTPQQWARLRAWEEASPGLTVRWPRG